MDDYRHARAYTYTYTNFYYKTEFVKTILSTLVSDTSINDLLDFDLRQHSNTMNCILEQKYYKK